MKMGNPSFLLLFLSLALLEPKLTQAFWRIPIKNPPLDTKVLAQLETFISHATKSLEEMNKSVHELVKQRRPSVCCYGEPPTWFCGGGGEVDDAGRRGLAEGFHSFFSSTLTTLPIMFCSYTYKSFVQEIYFESKRGRKRTKQNWKFTKISLHFFSLPH